MWVQAVATQVNKLTALAVQRKKKPGLYNDGGGLYLQISPNGTKSWIFRFKSNGRTRYMGLGSFITVSLIDARKAALECRKLKQQGVDPIDNRKGLRAEAKLSAAKAMTFDKCRDAYIDVQSHAWKNKKHHDQWTNSLTTHASPVIGHLSVQDINVELVEKVLMPIWSTKTETAKRVQGRIESILDWAKIKGYRKGENPARWKGHLDQVLPAPSKLQKVRHHSSLLYPELPGFMIKLRERSDIAAKALEFVILTAARTNEVLGATWDEIELDRRVWTLPAERMKVPREHRVPLSEPAIAILTHLQALKFGEFVFPGAREGKPH